MLISTLLYSGRDVPTLDSAVVEYMTLQRAKYPVILFNYGTAATLFQECLRENTGIQSQVIDMDDEYAIYVSPEDYPHAVEFKDECLADAASTVDALIELTRKDDPRATEILEDSQRELYELIRLPI